MKTPDFIKVIPNALTQHECKIVLDDFNVMQSQGMLWETQNPNQKINDSRASYTTALMTNMKGTCRSHIISLISNHVREYVEAHQEGMFSPKTVVDMAIEDVLVQKTEPTQGYHIWHCERQNLGSMTRAVAWILYLNDIQEGGETEFLYYSKRIKAEEGKLIIFPANFTHAHRGNPPLSDTKYIMTGWYRFSS